jgi:hypothetical protein
MAVPPSVSDVIYHQCEEFNVHPRTLPTMNQKQVKLTKSSLALDEYFHKSKSELTDRKLQEPASKYTINHSSKFMFTFHELPVWPHL